LNMAAISSSVFWLAEIPTIFTKTACMIELLYWKNIHKIALYYKFDKKR
jgi:hypothetical protein